MPRSLVCPCGPFPSSEIARAQNADIPNPFHRACISSIVRISYIPAMLSEEDATYVISNAMYWSVIETNIGILAASIPSFKALATRYVPGLLSSRSNTGSNMSGFKMMRRDRSKGDGLEYRKADVQTTVKTGAEANSSEENLFTVPGRIGVSTTVVRQTEDTRFGRGV